MNPQKLITLIIFFLFQLQLIYGAEIFNIDISNSPADSLITESINYVQNFEEGHTNGWESYPPFQDTGFDPNFYCKKIVGPNESKYSLMFEYDPTLITESEMGFIKKFLLIAEDDSKISFCYKANGYGDFRDLEVVLYGVDKKQYSYFTLIDDDSKWNFVEIPIQNFKNSGESIKSGTMICGFSVLTHIPKTNPDVTYRLFLDELNITALRPMKFQITEPASNYLENIDLIVPLHHYGYGEVFSLSAELSDKINLKFVKIDMSNPNGKYILRNIPLAFDEANNSWIKKNLYTFVDKDQLGRWKVEIKGEDAEGKIIESDFNIWLTQKNQTHPRIYFSDDNKNQLTQKISSSHWKDWWDELVTENAKIRETSNVGAINFGAETSSLTLIPSTEMGLESLSNVDLGIYDTVHLIPTLYHYFNIIQPAEKLLQENALIYAMTGDIEAGNFAKEALIIIAGWETWTHPWFAARHRETYYPVGELGVRAAFCYDIVYALMTEAEREKVREGLLKNCIIPEYTEYVLENRVPSGTSNWISNSVSGGITCALSIYGDTPDDFEPYLSGLIKKLEDNIESSLDTTGAWGEGIGYQGFAFANLLPTISVMKNVLKYDMASEGLFNAYKYFLYNYSDPEFPEVGDSHPELTTLSNFAWFSSHSNDPVFQWFYMQSPRKNIFDFMFGCNKGEVKSPESLPKAKVFPDLGAAVFRSGWSTDDIVLNFRSGHFYNHQHIDQGNFQLNAFGEKLIPEVGGANYYNDPWYPCYHTQPIGHNTLLLDGDGGSQRSGDYWNYINAANKSAKMKNFITTDFYSAATGDLKDVYRDKLKKYERNIIFMNRKYFVIYDKLRSAKVPHEYDLLFHFDDSKEVNLKDGNVFRVRKEKASLYSQVVFPEKLNMKIIEGPIKLGPPITKPGYVQVSNSKKSMSEDFITLLYPTKCEDDISKYADDVSTIKGDGYIGVNVDEEDQSSLILFRTGEAVIETAKISTDAGIATATFKNNKLLNFTAHNVLNYSFDGNKLFETNERVTFAAKINYNSSVWEIISDNNGYVNLYLSSTPVDIRVNNNKLSRENYKLEGNILVIPISDGNNSVELFFLNSINNRKINIEKIE